MRCMCLQHFGRPMAMEVRDRPVPVGRQVLVRVEASGVCHSDLHMLDGGYDAGRGETLNLKDRGFALPRILGHEIVGRIEAVGEGVEDLDLDASYVICPWIGCGECRGCTGGQENLCTAPRFLGVFADGGHADYVVVPDPRYLVDIGDINPAEAAPLACSGVTTFAAIRKLGPAITQRPTMVIGAGGLGLMAVSILRALGARTILSIDVDDAKLAAARAAGATHAVNSTASDALAQIAAACDGPPLSILDLVGNEATARLSFDSVGKGGTIVMVGLYGGGTPWPLPLIAIKALNIHGSYVGTVDDLRQLIGLVKAGSVALPSVRSVPLQDVQEVLEGLRAGTVVGRTVLDPARPAQ